MTFSDEVLMAYADGELDSRTRAAVEAAMAADPEIARRIARHEALRSRVHGALRQVLDEPVPERLLETVRRAPSSPRVSRVGPVVRRPAGGWAWSRWTAIAASLLIGVIAGRMAFQRAGDRGPIATGGGVFLARGALADALSNQLASAPAAAGRVRVGVSFRAKSGEYCRTFTLRQEATLAGLACRTRAGWRIGVLARAQSPGGGSGAYREAASSMPPAVVAAVNAEIAGEPLGANAEAAARARDWRP